MKASEALMAILDVIMKDGDCEIMIADGSKNVSVNDISQDYNSTLVSAGEEVSHRIIRIVRQ